MSPRSIALFGALASLVVAGTAYAESIGTVIVKNPTRSAVSIEYRVGPSKECATNHDFVGTVSVPPGDLYKLTVRNEGFACVRVVAGKTWWWNKVAHGQVHQFVVN